MYNSLESKYLFLEVYFLINNKSENTEAKAVAKANPLSCKTFIKHKFIITFAITVIMEFIAGVFVSNSAL